ncbi:MAG TPA: M23 family metallopeptidase [Geobacteraceae bacterium]
MAQRQLFSREYGTNIPVFGAPSAVLATLLSLLFVLTEAECGADIYRYINEDGVVCFTDTPMKKGATRIMKEQKECPRPAPAAKLPHRARLSGGKSGSANGSEEKKGRGELAAYVLPVHGTVSSPVGMRHDPIDGSQRHHNGVDIAVREGTPVKPVAPGIVSFSGFRNGYGNLVIIDHDDGTITLYAHNSANLVTEGERVTPASPIALTGSTGRSTGPHLHFEAWKDGVNLTMTFMTGVSGKVAAASGPYRREEPIRRIVQADGTLLFTNLP